MTQRIPIEGIFDPALQINALMDTMRIPIGVPGSPGEWGAISWMILKQVIIALDQADEYQIQVSSNGSTWASDEPWPDPIRWWRIRFGMGAYTPAIPVVITTGHIPWAVSATAPSSPQSGLPWWNPTLSELRVYDAASSSWLLIGPTPVTPTPPTPPGTELIGTVASEVIGTGGPTPTPVPTHTRYIAISDDDTFDASEFLAGNTSVTNSLVVPSWSGGRRYIAVAVPDATGDISTISTGGIGISMAFMRVPGTVNINGTEYKVWRTINDQADNAAGQTYVVEQV